MRLPVPLAILMAGLLIIAAEGVIAAPTLTITSPPDGYVSSIRTINITGTASGSDARWVQTTQADFNAGTKDNITVTPGGDVRLAAGATGNMYDDFDDNSFNTTLWTKTEQNGLAISESNSELRIFGTAQADGWKMNGGEPLLSAFFFILGKNQALGKNDVRIL